MRVTEVIERQWYAENEEERMRKRTIIDRNSEFSLFILQPFKNSMLGIKLKALNVLGKCSRTE